MPMRLVTLSVLAVSAGAVAFAPGALAQLAQGDRVRIVTAEWEGEGVLQDLLPRDLFLSLDHDPTGNVRRVPVVQVRELLVAREEGLSPRLVRHLLVGGLATGALGAWMGAGTEYGAEAIWGLGLAFALPGMLTGTLVWGLRPRTRVRWEAVDLPSPPQSRPPRGP